MNLLMYIMKSALMWQCMFVQFCRGVNMHSLCAQPCDSMMHCVHVLIYAFIFIPHACVCVHVGGGGKDPGSTVSQAGSRQAGLSHCPPGESCLLWARAVMIVPAGGIAHAHLHTDPHSQAHMQIYIYACMHMRARRYVPNKQYTVTLK